MNQLIDLINVEYSTDSNGIQTATITSTREVFCTLKSVGMREVYQAMALSRKPELVAVLADYLEYQDETFAVQDGKCYRILRTYRVGDGIELTLERDKDIETVINGST